MSPTSAVARRPARALLAVLLAASASACGGGKASYAIEVTPGAATFEAIAGGPLPAQQVLALRFQGDGVLVALAPGQTEPAWLTVSGNALTSTTGTLRLGVNTTGLPPGTYGVTLRVYAGNAEGTEYVSQDVTVTYRVRRGLQVAVGSMAFAALEGTAPAPQAIGLSSDAAGDGWTVVVRGGAPGWLAGLDTFGGLPGGAGELQVAPLAWTPGTHTAVLDFRDHQGTLRGSTTVTYQVGAVATATAGAAFTVNAGLARAGLERTVTLRTAAPGAAGAAYRFEASCGSAAFSVTPTSGDLSADVTFTVRLDPEQAWALPNGAHPDHLTLAVSGATVTSVEVPIDLTVALAPALSAPATVSLSVGASTTQADLARSVPVGSNLGEVYAAKGAWTAGTTTAWLSVGAVGAAGAPLVLDVPAAGLAAKANGAYQAAVIVTPNDPRVAGATVQVALQLDLPEVQRVAPSVAFQGRSQEVVLRGAGFGADPTLPLLVGGEPATGRVLGATEARLTLPAPAAAGPLAVTASNALGLTRGGASLTVVAPPAYGAHVEEIGALDHLALDAGRQAILLAGGGKVRRLAWDGAAWQGSEIALPTASGVALIDEGRRVLVSLPTVSTSGSVGLFELDPVTLAVLRQSTRSAFYEDYDLLAPMNDGRVLVIDSNQWAATFWYGSTAAGPYLDSHGTSMLLTRDGSRVYTYGGTLGGLRTLDAGADAFVARSTLEGPYNMSAWSVSGDGGRLMVVDSLYDRDVAYLGTVTFPAGEGAWARAVSPDGAFAYTVGRTSAPTLGPWNFRRTAVSGPGPYAADAAPLALSLPSGEWPVRMLVTDDGGALVLITSDSQAGKRYLRVLPIP